MSVVAWDGKTLAADKQATCADMASKSSKLKQLPTGEVLAWTGDQEQGLALAQWYESGADVAKWPEFQKGDTWSRLIVADADGAHYYEILPVQQRLDEPFIAWGSGRDFAMGAMAMGADAIEAVEVASRFSITCGCGCDSFQFNR